MDSRDVHVAVGYCLRPALAQRARYPRRRAAQHVECAPRECGIVNTHNSVSDTVVIGLSAKVEGISVGKEHLREVSRCADDGQSSDEVLSSASTKH